MMISFSFYITLELFIYIWVVIFISLLITLLILIRTYLKKKKELMSKSKEHIPTFYEPFTDKEDFNKDLNKTIEYYEKFIKEGNQRDAIIYSYNKLKLILFNHFHIKIEEYYTEKESLEKVYLTSPYFLTYKDLFKVIYQIYEKARFGNPKNLALEEANKYFYSLKKLIEGFRKRYGEY